MLPFVNRIKDFLFCYILYSTLKRRLYRSHQLSWVPLLIGQFELRLRLSRNQWDTNWPWWSSYHQSSQISIPKAFAFTNKPGLLKFQNYYAFYLDFIRLRKLFSYLHSEQLVWSGYLPDWIIFVSFHFSYVLRCTKDCFYCHVFVCFHVNY